MKYIYLIIVALIYQASGFAQNHSTSKDTVRQIEEVKITGTKATKIEGTIKKSVSVDEFFASKPNISFIKRGAYAWEPLLNNMGTERSTLTIDGMHVFGACTDKMDPVSTYLESNSLADVNISSGQSGSLHGATVAGNIDLQRTNTVFGLKKKWSGSYQSAFETNNNQYANLGSFSYSGEAFTAVGSISHRKAGNYQDGNNQEVYHSQYNKINTSLALGYKTSTLSSVHIDAIFDRANDVGFPALPMDLWLSRALITSATYKRVFEDTVLKSWDTKVYYNAIEHYMDDTKRPNNKVHMDMPGWSTTYGMLSKLVLGKNRYQADIQLNAYENVSIAEMTMYPQDRSQKTMFAYSWPWVTTRYVGASINQTIALDENQLARFGGTIGWNNQNSKYAEFNRIFHPDATSEKSRILPSLHAAYETNLKPIYFTFGLGYGHRAPSISEAYGYYIYNSFDRYDYIGNPNLKNEVSYEVNASVEIRKDHFGVGAKFNYFHIQDYIIGKILSVGSPMNYQSVGVKGYTSLDYATLFNYSIVANYHLLHDLHWNGTLTYARAQDFQGGNLPFIRPLSYQSSFHFVYQNFSIQTSVEGDLSQTNYSPEYGENFKPAFAIWNLSADYNFQIQKLQATVQFGSENLLNHFYITYADWGNIPRMGRNLFTSLKINF